MARIEGLIAAQKKNRQEAQGRASDIAKIMMTPTWKIALKLLGVETKNPPLFRDIYSLIRRTDTRKPTVPEVRPLIERYGSMPGNGVGGSLHIVLDDDNLSDDNVDSCRQHAAQKGDYEGEGLAILLLRMSRTQRSKLSGAHCGVTARQPAAHIYNSMPFPSDTHRFQIKEEISPGVYRVRWV